MNKHFDVTGVLANCWGSCYAMHLSRNVIAAKRVANGAMRALVRICRSAR